MRYWWAVLAIFTCWLINEIGLLRAMFNLCCWGVMWFAYKIVVKHCAKRPQLMVG
jgi:hypothetical protein